VAHDVRPGLAAKEGMILPTGSDNDEVVVDPKDAAETAGLRYVSDVRPGIHRKKAGKAFTYIRADGSRLTEPHVLKRIKALEIQGSGNPAGLDRRLDLPIC
jgi:hypothetical protein